MNTAATAAATPAPRARKPKADTIDRQLEIHSSHLRQEEGGKKAKKAEIVQMVGLQQVKQFVDLCKSAGKKERKLLAEASGFEPETIKVIGKLGPKEVKNFEKGLAKKLAKAKMQAFFSQLSEHGIEAKYVKGKSKSLDKLMSDVGDKSESWSVWQILGAALAAGLVGVALYEGYQWSTGGQGLFGDYSYRLGGGAGGGAAYSQLTFDSPANVAQMR